jgi:hypothetical protein
MKIKTWKIKMGRILCHYIKCAPVADAVSAGSCSLAFLV